MGKAWVRCCGSAAVGEVCVPMSLLDSFLYPPHAQVGFYASGAHFFRYYLVMMSFATR